MIYNTDDSVIGFELARLRSRRRQAERMSISQEVLPAIKINIGEWYVDGKLITRDTWLGMSLVCAGIAMCVVSKT